MQKNAGNSIWNDDKFYESLLSEPDYVIIMMGTNDA
jgi:hypothetical protein